MYNFLSYNVASWSDITPCIKNDKPLVVCRFLSRYVLTSIITSPIHGKILAFSRNKSNFKVVFDFNIVAYVLLN